MENYERNSLYVLGLDALSVQERQLRVEGRAGLDVSAPSFPQGRWGYGWRLLQRAKTGQQRMSGAVMRWNVLWPAATWNGLSV